MASSLSKSNKFHGAAWSVMLITCNIYMTLPMQPKCNPHTTTPRVPVRRPVNLCFPRSVVASGERSLPMSFVHKETPSRIITSWEREKTVIWNFNIPISQLMHIKYADIYLTGNASSKRQHTVMR